MINHKNLPGAPTVLDYSFLECVSDRSDGLRVPDEGL